MAQIELIVVRSTPYFSANSRWVAEEVSIAVNTSYFCEGANRLRFLLARGCEPPVAVAVEFDLVIINLLVGSVHRTSKGAEYWNQALVTDL